MQWGCEDLLSSVIQTFWPSGAFLPLLVTLDSSGPHMSCSFPLLGIHTRWPLCLEYSTPTPSPGRHPPVLPTDLTSSGGPFLTNPQRQTPFQAPRVPLLGPIPQYLSSLPGYQRTRGQGPHMSRPALFPLVLQAELYPQKFVCWSTSPQVHQNVTIFGDRALKKMIQWKWDPLDGS